MKGFIFAAGLGTRLKPFTDTMPKALLPIAGKPLLWHVIQRLKAAGIDEIVVNVHHFADKIEEYLSKNDFGVKILISSERERLLDTGGAVLHARNLLQGGNFIVHNVDIFSNLDIAGFAEAAGKDREALATLVVSERKSSRQLLFDDDMRLVGRENAVTGVTELVSPDIDPGKCRRLAFSGIHAMSPGIFEVMDQWHSDEKFPIMDFYLSVGAEHPVKGYVQPGLSVLDVGKPESIPQAGEFCRKYR